ncbi:MAG: tryptophan synthase subunit alpha [Acidimicrobiia bacterium]
MIDLEAHLRQARDVAHRKLFVPYVSGGLDAEWVELVRAFADAGADAIEIGIPFSDPVMDGPTIQEASVRALERGTTPFSVVSELRGVADEIGIPLIVMTYYNIVFRAGHERFAEQLVEAGISGTILPDLPLEESGPWREVADAAGIANILLAAPTAPDERLPRICEAARGFVYAVSLLGVTGERQSLATTAVGMATRLKAVTDRPVLIGIGISNAEQAVEACTVADGVIMASALMRMRLDGASVQQVADAALLVRKAIDG